MVRHRFVGSRRTAKRVCFLASWFLSRDVAVHSGVHCRRGIRPGTSVLHVPQENAPGRPWRHDNNTYCRRDGLAKTLAQPPGDSIRTASRVRSFGSDIAHGRIAYGPDTRLREGC